MLNYQKQEQESLSEQMQLIEKGYEKLENENLKMHKIKDELIVTLDRLVKRVDNGNESNAKTIKKDIANILQLLIENSMSSFSNETSHSVDDRNISHDDYNNNNLSNISSKYSNSNQKNGYITQNYEKFKQSQEAKLNKNNNENKFGNQSINTFNILNFSLYSSKFK